MVFTGPGRESLFDQIRELWPFPPPDHAVVTSPFFDDGDAATITAQNLESIMNQRGDRRICFVVQATTLPNLAIQLELPRCLKASQRARTEYVHYRVLQGRDEQRALHAKILHLERDNQGIHCIGSSNFTRAGTGARTDGGPINVEANLVYILPDVKSDFGRVCDLARPNDEEVDSDNATFITPNDSSADASGYVALPKCFVSAVLRNDDGLLSLELQITGATPDEFQVLLPDNGVLLSAEDFVGIDRPALVQCRLAKNQAISYLLVTWRTNEQWVTGVWPVNVANNFVLPPAEELRDLNLEELLEILSAGGPAYLLLGRMLKRREARRNDPLAFETDPHKRIDTRHHLLKRMRRTAIALEELRSRIERATYSREALHWRLHGPLGPLALAGKLVAEESAHAAFFLAEVALTLASATLDPQGDLTRAEATTMIADVIQTLKLQANSHAAPANLSEYVKNTFLEVRS